MKMILKFIFFTTMLILFQSCIDLGIHISDFPLDYPGNGNVDQRLIGRWEKISEKTEDEGLETLEFILFNKNEYIIRTIGGGDKTLARAFITGIAGVSFLNLQDLSESERKYMFCKYHITDNNELILNVVGDTLFKSENPPTLKKLRKFIKKNLENPELFNKEMDITLKKASEQ